MVAYCTESILCCLLVFTVLSSIVKCYRCQVCFVRIERKIEEGRREKGRRWIASLGEREREVVQGRGGDEEVVELSKVK